MNIFRSIKTYFVLLLFLLTQAIAFAQSDVDEVHEITIYVMPTLKPLNWESPSTLYLSMLNCYMATIAVRNHYLLGHIAVKLKSNLLEGGELYIGQTSSNSTKEKHKMVFKEKIGMAILGASFRGSIESDEILRKKLKAYSKRKKLAFIKYRITKKAMERILVFIDRYMAIKEDGMASCDFYGGAFNPNFKNEGSGCSAFALALLSQINLVPENPDKWMCNVNIPMELIGGRYNNYKKIKIKNILNKKEWYNSEDGIENVDFVSFSIYEPSLMFQWILEERQTLAFGYQLHDEDNVPGLYKDAREIEFNSEALLFTKRPQPNLFIDVYMKERFKGVGNPETIKLP